MRLGALGPTRATDDRGGVAPASPRPDDAAPSAPPAVVVRDMHAAYGDRPVLRGVHLEVGAGELVALVGPNGAGKSTLLSVVAGDHTVTAGQVELAGRAVDRTPTRELARTRAVLPQRSSVAFPFLVEQLVAMGRAPWAGTPASDEDDEAVGDALLRADAASLRTRTVSELSGGELARVHLARVLAQRTPILLLDEPTAALDIRHQELVLQVARAEAAAGRAVVVVLHDLTLAGAYADRLVLVDDGTVVRDGPPTAVLDASLLSQVYGHEVAVVPVDDTLVVLPRRS
jgi:iron complex transport system ATP-binding protein